MTWFRRIALSLLGVVALYLGAAWAGSLTPVNAQRREAREGVQIYVATNGIHTGLIVPASEAGIDWLQRVRPEHLADPQLTGRWLLFGWGDRDFYLNTPGWRDLTPLTAVKAVTGSGGSLIHVDHLQTPEEAVDIRPITLSPAEYRRLADFIESHFAPGGPIKGYGERDLFYPARGRYSALRTCNNWTAEALTYAGVRVGRWTPFQGGVMRWFSRSNESSPLITPGEHRDGAWQPYRRD